VPLNALAAVAGEGWDRDVPAEYVERDFSSVELAAIRKRRPKIKKFIERALAEIEQTNARDNASSAFCRSLRDCRYTEDEATAAGQMLCDAINQRFQRPGDERTMGDFRRNWRSALKRPAREPEKQSRKDTLSESFTQREGWLWYKANNPDDPPKRVCTYFEILGSSRDSGSTNWGIFLQWNAGDGKTHKHVLPLETFAGEGIDYRRLLLSNGVKFDPGRETNQLLRTYLLSSVPDKLFLTTAKLGWNLDRSKFVLPERTLGMSNAEEENETIFRGQPDHRYNAAGTLEEWKRNVADLCAGNTRLIMPVCMGFAAPFLTLLEEESGGIHLEGNSSIGKSSALLVAGSVFGGGHGSGFVRSWETTINGLECMAEQHNDALLILDEIHQVQGRDAARIAYLLSNGSGRSRMTAETEARRIITWRLLYLSAGEKTLAEHADSAGVKTKAGSEVRLLNVPANPGNGYGLFENLHGSGTPAEFATRVKLASLKYYGTAFPAFVEYLLLHKEDTLNKARRLQAAFIKQHTSFATGEVVRAARRFGLLSAAGEIAVDAGIVDWSLEDIRASIAACFEAWVEGRGIRKDQTSDVEKAIGCMRSFIEAHGQTRFQDCSALDEKIRDCAGYRDGAVYWFFRESFQKVCASASMGAKAVARSLRDRGLLFCEEEKALTCSRKFRGEERNRYYAVRARVLSDEQGEQLPLLDTSSQNESYLDRPPAQNWEDMDVVDRPKAA